MHTHTLFSNTYYVYPPYSVKLWSPVPYHTLAPLHKWRRCHMAAECCSENTRQIINKSNTAIKCGWSYNNFLINCQIIHHVVIYVDHHAVADPEILKREIQWIIPVVTYHQCTWWTSRVSVFAICHGVLLCSLNTWIVGTTKLLFNWSLFLRGKGDMLKKIAKTNRRKPPPLLPSLWICHSTWTWTWIYSTTTTTVQMIMRR